MFFCGRSDYFKALLEDHFSEGEILTSQPNVPVLTLHNISYKVFISLLYYIYSDNTEVMSLAWQHTLHSSHISKKAEILIGRKNTNEYDCNIVQWLYPALNQEMYPKIFKYCLQRHNCIFFTTLSLKHHTVMPSPKPISKMSNVCNHNLTHSIYQIYVLHPSIYKST